MASSNPLMKLSTKSYALLGLALVAVIAVVSVFSYFNAVQKEGVQRQSALNAQYLDNQNELSAYVSGFYETLGVADRKSEQLNTILTEAVKGRYDGQTSAQPGQGQLFSAITEAYPDLTANLDTYDRVVEYISSGREAYKNKQSKLLDMIREYDSWRRSGFVHSKMVSIVGYPDEGLEARIGTQVVTGPAALEQMKLIVTTNESQQAYQSGTMDPLTIPSAG